MNEPIIHSHREDVLPEGHTLRDQTIYCDVCKEMLHFKINECMQTWVEMPKCDPVYKNLCLKCFTKSEGL